jgi:hypothetical protein
MNNEQLRIFLDSHGADPALWPAAQRASVERLIAQDAAACGLFHEAQQLDQLLARLSGVSENDENAATRVMIRLATLPPQKRPFWRWPSVLLDWQFSPAWPRMAALAGCAVIGFMVGFAGLDQAIENYSLLQTASNTSDLATLFEPEALT